MTSTHIGGIIAATPAAWVSSQQHIVVPFGRILRVFRYNDGSLQTATTLRGHSAAVVAVVQAGTMRIASASLDGTVRIWDADEGTCLRTIDLGQPLSDMSSIHPDRLVCVGSRSVVLLSLAFMDSAVDVTKQKIRTALFSNMPIVSTSPRIAASSAGEIVAMIDANILHITTISENPPPIARAIFPFHLSAVAVSRDAALLALADHSGRIYVVSNPTHHFANRQGNGRINLSMSDLSPSTLHWHASAVHALAFSEDNDLLLSGGNEAVLVSWNMTHSLLGSRTFLPRLCAPILGISFSPDQLMYTLTHSDNSVRLINQGTGVLAATVRGISTPIPTARILDPLTHMTATTVPEYIRHFRVSTEPGCNGNILVTGNGGDAQVFNVYKGQHVGDLPILLRNMVFEAQKSTRSNNTQPANVSHVRIHPSRKFMASVDFQAFRTTSSKQFGIERFITTLRIWERENLEDEFSQVSVEPQPHGFEGKVSCMCFHPFLPILATASRKGTFKLWRATVSEKTGARSWRCEAELGHKRLSCNALSFSPDGSILAVAAENILTLWHVANLHKENIDSNSRDYDGFLGRPNEVSAASLRVSLLHTLVHPPLEESIQAVSFASSRMPLVIAATDSGVYVWHTLTQGIWWSSRVRMKARLMVTDEHTDQFAITVEVPALDMDIEQGGKDIESDKQCEDIDLETKGNQDNDMGVESESMKGANGLKVGRNSTPVRRRSKPRISTGTRKTPKPSLSRKQSVDTAIAVFNAASPIPTVVARLPAGVTVAAMAFVPTPGSAEGTPSPLVCIDSNMEVSFYSTGQSSETLSCLTGETEVEALNSIQSNDDNLARLLGASWDRQAKTSSTISDGDEQEDDRSDHLEMESSLMSQAFSKVFDGPVHIQAPVSSIALDFVRELLPSASSAEQSEDAEQTGSLGTTEEDKPKGLDLSNAPVQAPRLARDPRVEREYRACSELCAKLVEPYLT